MSKKNILFLVILSAFVFSGIFSLNYLTFLDSVYFYKESYLDLISNVSLWSSYNSPFGGINIVLWLYPLTYILGLLGKIFNLDWNMLVRLGFYIPSIILSFYTTYRLAKKINLGDNGRFLLAFIYVFNTYFISLVDGGQLGVMLAYSFLPLAVESIINISYFKTTLILVTLSILDPRFLVLAIIVGILLGEVKVNRLVKLIPIFLTVLIIGSYWLIPIAKFGSDGVNTFVSQLKLTTIVDGLTLHQPHWPYNTFGKVSKPDILFYIFPLLLFASLVYKFTKEKMYWLFLFIWFVFLIKGENRPLGEIYTSLLNLPFASAFRDSTKFFTPLILIYGLIISRFYDELKNKFILFLIPVLLFIPLVRGLYVGNNHNLKGAGDVSNLLNLKEVISKQSVFSRTIYIPEKPQLAYQTETNQAIDGRVLVDYLPFAADNYGSEDRFNFMRRNSYINYFRSLGIKNLVYLSKNEPVVATLVNVMPEKYFIDKLAVVVGSPIGVENLVPDYGVLFLDDGNTNLEELINIPSEKLFFVLNNKRKDDLILAGLKDKYVDLTKINSNEWAKYSSNDYLTWKYQLLIRNIDTKDINYNNGVVFSTIKGESIRLPITVEGETKYKVFLRVISNKSNGIYVNDKLFKFRDSNNFIWVEGEFDLSSNNKELVITNNGGFNVIGAALIVKDSDYKEYLSRINNKLVNYQVLDSKSKMPESKIGFDKKEGWLILNQSYHPLWRLGDKSPFKINSIVNGFFVEKGSLDNEVKFVGQKYLDTGVKISIISITTFIILGFINSLWVKLKS